MTQRTSGLAEVLRHLILIAGALFILAPFLWAFSISLRPPEEIFTAQLRLLPDHLAFERNYRVALTQMPLLRFLLNGLVVCSGILICQLLIMVPCAYALAKLKFAGRSLLLGLVLIALAIPTTALSLPLFILASKAQLIDSYGGLIAPWTISAFGIFLMRQVFSRVPDDVIEAARLDGLSEFEILLTIMLPLVWPAIGAFSIYSFAHHWNDLLWPSVVTRSVSMATPPYGVMLFQSDEAGSDYGALMAGALLIMTPMVVIFMLAREKFIAGMSLATTK